MGIKTLFNMLPEFWVSIAFLQLGTWMVFMIYSFNMVPEFYHFTLFGPQVIACGGAVLTGVLLTCLRMWKGRVVFVHFFLILVGSGLFLLVAILSVVDAEKGEVYASALSIGGFCHGMVYVAGMTYVYIRSGAFRVQRVAFLQIMYMIGVATTAHSVHAYQKAYTEPRADGRWEFANHPIAYHFFAFSGLAVIVIVVNFFCNGRMYNAKSLMDNKMSLANGKNDNFLSTLGMPVIQGIAEKPQIMNQLKVFKLTLSAKLTGGLIFNSLLLGIVFYSQQKIFTGENEQYAFIIHYMVLLGLLFAYGASFFVQLKWLFIPGTILHCILLVLSIVMYTSGSYIAATIFMWLFFIIIGVCYFVPDNSVMEIAPLKFFEGLLGIGYCFEAVPLMIGTYKLNRTFPPAAQDLWISGALCMAGLLLAAIGMIFLYPDTFRKGIIEIQYMLIYPGKLFNIRPVAPPTQEVITIDLDPPTKPVYPPAHNENMVPSPIMPPVEHHHDHPTMPSANEVPYPSVTEVTNDEATTVYPGPPGSDSPRTAVIETTNIYADQGTEEQKEKL